MLLGGTELGFTYATASATDAAAPPSHTHAWKDGGSFSFHDLLDTLNPLQHIPIVGAIYRWATGDEPGNVARIVGDGLYGGPIGLAAGLFSVALKEETGEDPGEAVMAALTGSDQATASTAATAQGPAVSASTPPAPAAPPAAATTAAATTTTTAAATAAASAAPTSSAEAPVSAAAAAAPSRPDPRRLASPAPMMPLFRSAPAPVPPSVPGGMTAAEQDFLAQNAALQRTTFGARSAAQTRTFTAPVPLVLTGSALRPPPRPIASPVSAPTPVPAATAPAATNATSQPTPNTPIDVPQRMIDALDKYMQMQKQMPARGGAVDLSN